MQTLISTLLIPVVVIVGLIVLVALKKVDANVAVPIIIGLAGVHTGASITNNATSNPVVTPVPTPTPTIPVTTTTA